MFRAIVHMEMPQYNAFSFQSKTKLPLLNLWWTLLCPAWIRTQLEQLDRCAIEDNIEEKQVNNVFGYFIVTKTVTGYMHGTIFISLTLCFKQVQF